MHSIYFDNKDCSIHEYVSIPCNSENSFILINMKYKIFIEVDLNYYTFINFIFFFFFFFFFL